ncbi:MAG: FGGY-family carbohydrate kinase [Gammaproteobacteria bacterium]
MSDVFVGVDLGTSGCRACALDENGGSIAAASVSFDAERAGDPACWWRAVNEVLRELVAGMDARRIAALAVDGTSGSVLVTDARGEPLAPPLMYSDARAAEEAALIARIAPRDSAAAHGATASLAKLLWLRKRVAAERLRQVQHQADWVMGRLLGRFGLSDENNCLKLGYDPVSRRWPAWLNALDIDPRLLPEVYPAGTAVGTIDPQIARSLGLPAHIRIVTGTTDSVAGFIATGATRPGEAVTSLGSTLALKVISERPVCAPEHGIYSHRLGDLWLAGGASNTGGAVLCQFFSQAELDAMTPRLQPGQPTGLDYYPLPARGERFPQREPGLAPRLEPRPPEDLRFFQGILEGIAAIEREGYARLHALGAPYPARVRTVGGGARNPAWAQIRQRLLGVPVTNLMSSDAALGAALLARSGVTETSIKQAIT